MAAGAEPVGHAEGQRLLGADHGQVDGVFPDRGGHPVEVIGSAREVGGDGGSAGVARGGEDGGGGLFAAEGRDQRVFAAPATDDQQPHLRCWASRKASRARSAALRAASLTELAASRSSLA